MNTKRITNLLGIQYPIIQGGMVWCSGWKLASAVSNNGGLGLIGAGSMHPDTLLHHIQSMKQATQKPWGVNIPLMYPQIDIIIDCIIKSEVPIVFTSAGSPKIWTKTLQSNGIKVVHVVSSTQFALKSEDAGVDAIVAEGFEAGGHNGKEETTTMSLIPKVIEAVKIPVIAAGGIATGKQMAAAIALGANGVQIGSRFAVCKESSAHENFKQYVYKSQEGDTMLCLKKVSPTRLLKNDFFNTIYTMEQAGASAEELKEVLGKGRAKKGIFEGNLSDGELEIGQVASMINSAESVTDIFSSIITEYNNTLKSINQEFI
jgi:enoyl-[acyl-carrier protein] reductase II